MIKLCIVCGNQFYKTPSDSREYWAKKESCSRACAGRVISKKLKGKQPKNVVAGWNKGKKNHWNAGSNHSLWKGDDVSKAGLHLWVKYYRGKANKCENPDCIYPRKDYDGRLMLAPKIYHWANRSRQYKRDLDDWVQLCPSCHQTADQNKWDLTDMGRVTETT
jgi:hypothetical protein